MGESIFSRTIGGIEHRQAICLALMSLSPLRPDYMSKPLLILTTVHRCRAHRGVWPLMDPGNFGGPVWARPDRGPPGNWDCLGILLSQRASLIVAEWEIILLYQEMEKQVRNVGGIPPRRAFNSLLGRLCGISKPIACRRLRAVVGHHDFLMKDGQKAQWIWVTRCDGGWFGVVNKEWGRGDPAYQGKSFSGQRPRIGFFILAQGGTRGRADCTRGKWRRRKLLGRGNAPEKHFQSGGGSRCVNRGDSRDESDLVAARGRGRWRQSGTHLSRRQAPCSAGEKNHTWADAGGGGD